MARIIVGMSGGVDSSVAAYLLKAAGHEVIGVTLKNWETEEGSDSRFQDIKDAKKIAEVLGIQHVVLECAPDFRERVIQPFIKDYLNGLTPSPCTGCNRCLKWAKMLDTAKAMQAEYVATGHYAKVIRKENGRYTVQKADCEGKDQAYMLYRLSQEQLKATLMPLGKLSKDEVRKIAAEAGLPVAQKRDSQELCFVADGSYAEYIKEHATLPVPGEGDFVDENGKFLGKHRGIIHYTVGQRKNLGLAMGHPVYVKEIRAGKNEVVIAEEESLYQSEITCRDLNFMSIPDLPEGEELRAFVKIRYHHNGQYASIWRTAQDQVRIVFDEPVRAAAPGQSAVFYDAEDCVIGGGVIE